MPTAQQIIEAIKELDGYKIEIGVFTPEASRTEENKTGKKKKPIKDENGVTNADLLFIHEFGSAKAPSRPILDITLEYARKTFIENAINNCVIGICTKGWSKPEIEKELSICCKRIQDWINEQIHHDTLDIARNAPSTIKQKGFDHPLFQTGNLANSIRCILTKK